MLQEIQCAYVINKIYLYGFIFRLYTSIHALKPKLKSKVAISESIALNEGPRNTIMTSPTPLLPFQTNMRIIFKIQE